MSFIPFATATTKAIKRYEVTSLSTLRAGFVRHFDRPIDMKLDQYGQLLVPPIEDLDLSTGTYIMVGVGGATDATGTFRPAFLKGTSFEDRSYSGFLPAKFLRARSSEPSKKALSSISLLGEEEIIRMCVEVISQINLEINSIRDNIERTLESMKGVE